MDLLEQFAGGRDGVIHDFVGPILLVVMVFVAVLMHRVPARQARRTSGFVTRIRAAQAAGYLSKAESAEIIGRLGAEFTPTRPRSADGLE
jgi:hypothetical protein